MSHRQEVVKAFAEDCAWVRTVREHFAVLFESGEKRQNLLGVVAGEFFHDLNLVLIDYLFVQLCRLTDPASSGKGRRNLTSRYILELDWSQETRALLDSSNRRLIEFRGKLERARSKLIVHADVDVRLGKLAEGEFTQQEEEVFWSALQAFVSAAYLEAFDEPFEIRLASQGGDAHSLVSHLIDAVDYEDMVQEDSELIMKRISLRRYGDA